MYRTRVIVPKTGRFMPSDNQRWIITFAKTALFALLLGSMQATAVGKIVSVERTQKLGTTVVLKLENAPFPVSGKPYDDNSVIVFVPHYYNLQRYRNVDAVVFFHGHHNTVEGAMRRHQLRQQLVESRQNAILIMPQGPLRAADSSGGKLSRPRGLSRMLTELARTLRTRKHCRKLKGACMPRDRRIKKLILAAHSGGYQVAADIISGRHARRGGFEVREIYLFDALYGRIKDFEGWLRVSRQHKLISFYVGGSPAANNRRLREKLIKRGIPVLHEDGPPRLTRQQLTEGRAIFIHTRDGHSKSTYLNNQLRDCLYASSLRRHRKSRWFRRKRQPRTLDPRARSKNK